jgi:hypothetical protein
MLLSYLQVPVDIRFETFFLNDGRPAHRLTLFQEGQTESQSFVSEGARNAAFRGVNLVRDSDQTLNDDISLASTTERYNKTQTETNERAATALRDTVGQNIGADPKAWWEWWAHENELYGPAEKPVSYMTRVSGARPVELLPLPVRYHSCFVAGTEVWTPAGQMPIENIRPGEFVLAQNVDTGEMAYKSVAATTVGPKLPLIEIHVGADTIRCTYGHLFWVSGVGWRMAKELREGNWLHTAIGPVLIDSVERKGEASCHNLIVADFNTYFVGQQQLLVHDINVRGPTTAIVPGLVDDEDAAAVVQPTR